MRQLRVWATALSNKYRTSIFSRTWWNIILFHTFFVIVMVFLFGVTLYYTKLLLFETFQDTLNNLLTGEPITRDDFLVTTDAIGRSTYYLYAGIIVFSLITSMIAAHITLGPTREAFAMQRRFIGTVAHELRTPLAVMRTENEVALYDLEEGSSAYALVKDNIEQIKSMTTILNNLLVFSRIDTRESIRFERVNVTTVLGKTIERLEALASRRKIKLVERLSVVPVVRGNTIALEQAIYNIIKNAILHGRGSGGAVEVYVEKTNDGTVTIRIKDDGKGIEAHELIHIFEPFYRAESDEAGSGLGLAIVYEIMKLHKGTIHVSSEPGRGTTMDLHLPIWDEFNRVAAPVDSELVSFSFKVT